MTEQIKKSRETKEQSMRQKTKKQQSTANNKKHNQPP